MIPVIGEIGFRDAYLDLSGQKAKSSDMMTRLLVHQKKLPSVNFVKSGHIGSTLCRGSKRVNE